jgi:carotenoid cleavage dioxygenase
VNVAERVLEGAVPADIAGVYIRNTEQPTHESLGGNYHPFDGDAMLHQVTGLAGILVQLFCDTLY